MHTETTVEKFHILPLRQPIALFIDDSRESRRAETLLKSAGVDYYLSQGEAGPFKRKPAALCMGGFHQGLEEIRDLLCLLHRWSNQEPVTARSVFRLDNNRGVESPAQ